QTSFLYYLSSLFYRAASHPDLHSFPTRRSSDLQEALYPYNDPDQLPITPVRSQSGDLLRLPVELPGYKVWLRAWQVQVGREPARDRKSTRLNSSHGSISYAVFCLKKKKATIYTS